MNTALGTRAAGTKPLVDGRLGSEDFRDGAWQAAGAGHGQDMVAITVDSQDAWIFEPESILWDDRGRVCGEGVYLYR